jgi:epoxyqueuosine reductase
VRSQGLGVVCCVRLVVPAQLARREGPQRFYNGRVTDRTLDRVQLVSSLQIWARELGFSQIGVTGVDLSTAEPGLQAWLAAGFHGDMHYMARHGLRRARPAELLPGTVSVVTARMDYLPRQAPADWQNIEWQQLQRPAQAQVAVYARGRDYHKVLRQRLQSLATRLAHTVGPLGFRVFTDSAPVLEAELAARSGLGWRGKHTLVLNREAGSMFFLGEIFLDFALPPTPAVSAHCGSCQACMDVCPTQAIVEPGRLDARRCIAYLTIEHAGPIPLDMRPLLGNRILGCDDCQLVCPWNKFAQRAQLSDFDARAPLVSSDLLTLWRWTPEAFLRHTEGSAIRRIGHERWQRNLAVAMGNALRHPALPAAQANALRTALADAQAQASELLREHISWALQPLPGSPALSATRPAPATS